ncbi:hypothetical protein [Bifidobacterium sp.]|jgi:hypothetical protein|uniref:hypothetical protein n=1 Tax=Bifidobacterium sp. TaxID=41200 RepID=UPI0025B9DBE4|nr:hypothetical protein [Bifidobacterium sp.]MCH4209219.1 hypothetical protein [Bifidobacterium sp.]MCI1224670.1 hypothetical protein [Bifidobacterium sp.]
MSDATCDANSNSSREPHDPRSESGDDILRRYPKLAEQDGAADEDRIATYSGILAQLQRELDSSRG